MTIPETFGPEFLAWFRAATERAWAHVYTPTFEELADAGFVGVLPVTGMRWLDGLTEPEIDEAERRYGVRFPSDYRLLLRTLHTTDRQQKGVTYRGREPMILSRPTLTDWRETNETASDAREEVYDGLAFDVEHGLWLPAWGARPDVMPDRLARLRELVAMAPALIRVHGHRFLLAEPCAAGNPVLSIHQSDLIVYGADLRQYLLNEFQKELGIEWQLGWNDAHGEIPFWGPLLQGDHRCGKGGAKFWDERYQQ